MRKRHDQGRIGFWKAFLVDKGRIVIDDADAEPGQGRGTYQGRDNMPTPKHPQGWCGQYRLQQESERAAILGVVVLQDTLFPEQHVLAAVSHHRFEPRITQPADHRAVVTHQELAAACGVAWMLGEDGRERATMPGVLQGDERAYHLVSLFSERLDEQFHRPRTIPATGDSVFIEHAELPGTARALGQDPLGSRTDIRVQDITARPPQEGAS